jgi:TrpR-related protein YerC/YecD
MNNQHTDQDKQSLYRAILSLQDESEAQIFLRDLLTETEIDEFVNRWKVARMLDNAVPYEVIAKETGMSSTTIARISKWIKNGTGGYRLMLKRIKEDEN